MKKIIIFVIIILIFSMIFVGGLSKLKKEKIKETIKYIAYNNTEDHSITFNIKDKMEMTATEVITEFTKIKDKKEK